MKYDFIISNPPFSDRTSSVYEDQGDLNMHSSTNLDSLFVLRATELSDKVVMILRAKHFRSKQSAFRKELFGSGKVAELCYIDSRKVFPGISNTETCVITIDQNHSGPCRVIYADGSVKEIKLHKDRCIRFKYPEFDGMPAQNNMGYRWKFGDIARHAIVDDPNGRVLIEILDFDSAGKVIAVIRKTNQTTTGYNEHGVVMNYNYETGLLGKLFVKPKNASISGSIIMLKTESKEESIELLNYLESDEVRKVVEFTKGYFCNSRYVFNAIEDIK